MNTSTHGIRMLLLAFGLVPASSPAQPALPSVNPNLWNTTFYDGFDGTKLDETKWDESEMIRQGGRSVWTRDLVKVDDGFLKLGIQKATHPETGATYYRCGAVSTREEYTPVYHFKQKYGYYEARCKLPTYVNKDYWASFWIMAGPVARNPVTGYVETDTRKAQEIDIFESLTFSRPVHSANFHWGGYDIDHNKYSHDCGTGPINTIRNAPGDFHVFGFYWDKDMYVFYLNGTEIGRTNMVGVGKNVNKQEEGKPPLIDYPAQGTAQVEGNILITCEASIWPGANLLDWEPNAPAQDEFVIDYVRVYALKPPFEVWSNGNALPFGGDANLDGVQDGVAWLLGSTSPGENANGLLPTLDKIDDGGCKISFSCLNAANRGSAVLYLQLSRDLGLTDPWEDRTILVPSSSGTDPSSGVTFTITPSGHYHQVEATIPSTALDGSGRIFGRLQALPSS